MYIFIRNQKFSCDGISEASESKNPRAMAFPRPRKVKNPRTMTFPRPRKAKNPRTMAFPRPRKAKNPRAMAFPRPRKAKILGRWHFRGLGKQKSSGDNISEASENKKPFANSKKSFVSK